MTEFSKTASQNADHIPPSNPLLLICSPYLGPSLRLPFINMATWGPVVERLHSEWTIDPSDWIICKCIVFFVLFTARFLSSLYFPLVSYLLRYLSSSTPTLLLYFVSPLKPTPISLILNIAPLTAQVTFMTCHLSLPLWHQAADSSLGVGLLRPFPSLRACTEGETFIDNYMRWSRQGLLWGIDSSDHGHYSASQALCLRTWPDSSFSLRSSGCSSLYRISIMGVLYRYYHLFSQNFTGQHDNRSVWLYKPWISIG